MPAFDIDKLFRTQVGTESGFGHHHIVQRQSGAGGSDGIAAVGDVGERPAVNKHRVVLQALHQIRLQRLFQQHRQRAFRPQITHGNRRHVRPPAHDDVTQPLLQIRAPVCQAQNRHDLGRRCDIKPGFPGHTVGCSPKAAHHVAHGPVGQVHYPAPAYVARVQPSLVAPVDVVVDQRCQQVVGGRDGVEVAIEMQVDVFHRNHLGPATTGSPAFHAKTGAQGRLPQAHR